MLLAAPLNFIIPGDGVDFFSCYRAGGVNFGCKGIMSGGQDECEVDFPVVVSAGVTGEYCVCNGPGFELSRLKTPTVGCAWRSFCAWWQLSWLLGT